jgi:hypothetical protein
VSAAERQSAYAELVGPGEQVGRVGVHAVGPGPLEFLAAVAARHQADADGLGSPRGEAPGSDRSRSMRRLGGDETLWLVAEIEELSLTIAGAGLAGPLARPPTRACPGHREEHDSLQIARSRHA